MHTGRGTNVPVWDHLLPPGAVRPVSIGNLAFFIISNSENTKARKNENLYGLYKMLEFCEEPYLCRRKVLLNYLDEDFRSKECNNMCDNCQKDLRVADIDFTD